MKTHETITTQTPQPMTMAEWNTAAILTAQWIRESEEAGDHDEAKRLRDVIWSLYPKA